MVRPGRRFRRVALAALGIALAALVGPRLWALARLHRSERLPDGTRLAVLSTTYGRQHPSFHPSPFAGVSGPRPSGRPPVRLRDVWFALRHPMAWVHRWRISRRPAPHPPPAPPTLTTPEERLVIWLSRKSGGPPFRPYIGSCRVVAIDRHGCAFPGGLQMQSDVGTEATAAFAFAAFPRRERVFPIEISEDGQRVVRFVVPNPVYRDYPEWKPQPLPATVRRGDFEFTLREFEFVSDGGTHGSHSVTRNGVPVRDWMAHDRVYFDATGNTANTPTLCRCEGAWGLRETFVYSPLPDAESGRGASFPPITVPPPGAKREIDVSATDAGTRLSLVSIAAEREPPREAVPTLPYGMWAERGHVSLLVLCSKDMVLGWRAFRIRDDRGRSLPVGVGRTAPRHLHLTTRVNSDSRTIRIEFTSQPPEEAQVEFLIQPPPPP